MKLDKEAAGRFIKHGLVCTTSTTFYKHGSRLLTRKCLQSGNEKYDLERKEREAKEKAMASVKAAMLARKRSTPSDSGSAPSTPSSKKRR
ncbi:hypothetical protein KEM55_000873 [Ascosphaera atra]|nr:hypothetical protein KEM55_000873 [Ascosphaera atra]